MRKLTPQQKEQANKRFKRWVKKDRVLHPEKYTKYYKTFQMKHPKYSLVAGAKKRAKSKGLPFSLKETDFEIPKRCPILDIPLIIGMCRMSDNSPTLDRKKNALGYSRKNVQVVSAKANAMKNNATPKELRKFAAWVTKIYGT
jgi:hypothetical protein